MKVVIDHVSGSRRGQRQELPTPDRITFGRHPSCTVSFDALRDLDASSQHAELRIDGDGAVLVDIGSSNGTFVGGEKIVERRIDLHQRAVVEFGPGGPQVSIWVGADDDAVPAIAASSSRRSLPLWLLAAALAIVAGLVIAQVFG